MCVGFKSFRRRANTDLKEIGPETWLTETEGIQMLEEDVKYKAVVSWIKQRHKSVCRSTVAGKITRNPIKVFDSYAYPL